MGNFAKKSSNFPEITIRSFAGGFLQNGRAVDLWRETRTDGSTLRVPVERDRRGTGHALAPQAVTRGTHTTTAEQNTVAPPRTHAPDRSVTSRSDGRNASIAEERP